jgi:hypothetical protein
VFVGCVLSVVIKPKLFTSGFVGGLGTVCFYIFAYFMPFRVFIEFFTPISGTAQIPVWVKALFAIALVFIFIPIFRNLTKRELNKVQYYALQAMNPDRLMAAIRPYEKILKDKYQALTVKLSLESELSYGVKEELIKLYVEENQSKTQKFWVIVTLFTATIAMLNFVFSSLGQSVIEDFIYVPYNNTFASYWLETGCETGWIAPKRAIC